MRKLREFILSCGDAGKQKRQLEREYQMSRRVLAIMVGFALGGSWGLDEEDSLGNSRDCGRRGRRATVSTRNDEGIRLRQGEA